VTTQNLTNAVERLNRNTEKAIKAQKIRTWFYVVSVILIIGSFWGGLFLAYQRIDKNTREIRMLIQADCPFYRDLANSPIEPWTGQLGRNLVRDARIAYDSNCAEKFGSLDPIDPDLLKPQKPSPTPGRPG
jgi:hypothetical protein